MVAFDEADVSRLRNNPQCALLIARTAVALEHLEDMGHLGFIDIGAAVAAATVGLQVSRHSVDEVSIGF